MDKVIVVALVVACLVFALNAFLSWVAVDTVTSAVADMTAVAQVPAAVGGMRSIQSFWHYAAPTVGNGIALLAGVVVVRFFGLAVIKAILRVLSV